jgi:CRP-like cAMP-binding protein
MDNRKYAKESEEALAKQRVEDARRLREFAGFANYSDTDLKHLVEASHRTSTSGPWPLIREHTPSDACYILLNGEVAVYVGQERVAVLGPGEVIGESALRQGKLRNATVTTTGKADVLRITRDDMSRLLDRVPALRATMDETVAKHVPGAATSEPS